MVKIVDWYGHEQEVNPALFANEEYRYPKEPEYRSGLVKVKDIIQYCGYNDTHEFWCADDGPAHYMYNRIVAEVELYLGWRINNGYHIETKQLVDIENALNRYATLETKMSAGDILAHQLSDLHRLVFDVDQAFFQTNKMPRKNIYKAILFTYAFCVRNQAPQVALEAARSNDALSYLKKYSDITESNSLWKKYLDERIKIERNKLKLN